MEKIKISTVGNKGFSSHKYRCAGFTLFELILVIFITGVSVALVVVSIGRTYEKTVFKETAKKVFFVLKHAREAAIMERTTITFKIGEDNDSYWLEKNGVTYDRIHNVPRNIIISGESIIFFPKGNSSGGSIKIKDDKERGYNIEVDSVLGTPTIERI